MSDILMLQSIFLTTPLRSDILFSVSPIFVLRTAVVTKPITPGIFYQHLHFFSPNFVYLSCIDSCELKKSHHEFNSLNYLLLNLVSCTLSFSQLLYSLHHLIFLNPQIHRKFSTYQHLNHIFLFLNYSNLLEH